MENIWLIKYITEFLGTALLIILGNGAVANVELKGTKAHANGWMIIAWGYGCAVMIPALMFGNVSGNHINPAFTLGLAISHMFPWAHVFPYIIAQTLGAMMGQLLVVCVYRPYYLQTTESNAILGTFSTIDNVDNGSFASRKGALINGFLNEFIGSFILFFAALGLTKNYFGAEIVKYVSNTADLSDIAVKAEHGAQISGSLAGLNLSHMALGFLVFTLVLSLGGPTGPALNPARDLGPRLLHTLLPKSILGSAKADSKWWYAWVPVIAPISASILAVALFKTLYL